MLHLCHEHDKIQEQWQRKIKYIILGPEGRGAGTFNTLGNQPNVRERKWISDFIQNLSVKSFFFFSNHQLFRYVQWQTLCFNLTLFIFCPICAILLWICPGMVGDATSTNTSTTFLQQLAHFIIQGWQSKFRENLNSKRAAGKLNE